ncbi:predicted protein [Arabidopsis lyrata subsp. lyrata]|uniref:Predicted protein n=1 Tax=Arabidopsis lyrata subsp. lyrata TaxID=81972 RepID=D7L1X0_ARALL|nr:predicted protein [Arabidopsis lyrata subsp. lyrata]
MEVEKVEREIPRSEVMEIQKNCDALVDAPNMERIQMNLKRLSLTDIVIDINRVPKKKNLIEATDKAVSKPLARNLKVCGNKGVFSSHGDLAEDLSHISDVEVLVLKQRIYGQRKTVREIVGEEQMSLRMVAQQEAFTLLITNRANILYIFAKNHPHNQPLASKEKVEKESKKVVVLNFGPGYMKQPWKWRSSGKDLKLSSISTYLKSSGVTSATSYRITFDAKDPRDTSGSLQTFQTHVNERSYGSFLSTCTIACPLGEVTIGGETNRVSLHSFMPELPTVNPFQDDTDRFYVLKKSEILRVALDTTPDPSRPSEKGLDAYDAIFYIRYTDSCKARAGEDVDRVAIVRRIWDEKPEVFRIVGCTESFGSLGNGESTTSRETVLPGSKDIDSMGQSDMMVSTDMVGRTQSSQTLEAGSSSALD